MESVFDKILKALLTVFSLLLCTPALAVNVDDLLQAEVLVVGQGASARDGGFRQAMEQVLVKLSGRAEIAATPGLPAYLRRASTYVQQYRYRALQPLSGDGPADLALEEDGKDLPIPTHALEVEFAEAPLLRVLEALGVPIWGRDRPQTLLWIGVADRGGRYLVGDDGQEPIAQALQAQAAARGVPVLLPLLDVEDQAAVAFADVRGGFRERLLRAGRRYGVNRNLSGLLQQDRDGRWRAEWTLFSASDAFAWRSEALDVERLIAKGMDGLAGQLASLYAVRRSAAVNRLRLRVQDVRVLEDYGRISRFLADLSLTRLLSLSRVNADSLEFVIEVQGDRSDLERALALSPSLYADADGLRALFAEQTNEPLEPLLVYRYRP